MDINYVSKNDTLVDLKQKSTYEAKVKKTVSSAMSQIEKISYLLVK